MLNNPYDFTKHIKNNPDYEEYDHKNLKFTKLFIDSFEKRMNNYYMKRGKLYKNYFDEPQKLKEIKKNCLTLKKNGNKFQIEKNYP